MCQAIAGKLRFPASLKNIGEEAFMKCKSIQGIEAWPPNLVKVGKYAFAYNTKMTDLPRFQSSPKLESVGDHCFINCICMIRVPVPFPKTLHLGDFCFNDCANITNKNEIENRLIIGTRRASNLNLSPKDEKELMGATQFFDKNQVIRDEDIVM